MRDTVLILAALFSFCSASLFGGVSPSEWDFYCRRCHIERPVNSLYDPSIKAHSNATLSCVACHPNKGIAGHVKQSAENFRLLFQDMTLPPNVRPARSASMTSDKCLTCHFYIMEVDEIQPRKIPKAVRPIKLRAGHSQHWDYRTFTPAQRDKLKALMTAAAKSPLAKTEQTQLDRLSQIETMQCSRCHERFKKDSPGGIDPKVNIAMKNPMECTSCHIALRSSVHPGYAATLPSAVSCEWCHHGNLHQKMKFFAVDRGTDTECLKCHPGYARDELAAAKPDSFNHKSSGAKKSGSREKPDENRAVTPDSENGKSAENNKIKYPK
jgi:hypothetical protein